jgi:hypothetical protein
MIARLHSRSLLFAGLALILPALLAAPCARSRADEPGIGGNVPLKQEPPRSEYDAQGRLARTIREDENGVRFVTVYSPDGKVVSRHVEPPENPKVLARFDEQEKALLAAIDAATEDEKRGKLTDLANFYMFTTHDFDKAAKVIAQIDPDHSEAVRVQLVFYDYSLFTWQKLKAYKELLKMYPSQSQSIEYLINMTRSEKDHRWPILKF